MPKQRKLFTLDDDAVEKLGELAKNWGTSNSGALSVLIQQAHRVLSGKLAGEELCRMVYDRGRSEVRFEDMAGGVLAVFHLSE